MRSNHVSNKWIRFDWIRRLNMKIIVWNFKLIKCSKNEEMTTIIIIMIIKLPYSFVCKQAVNRAKINCYILTHISRLTYALERCNSKWNEKKRRNKIEIVNAKCECWMLDVGIIMKVKRQRKFEKSHAKVCIGAHHHRALTCGSYSFSLHK